MTTSILSIQNLYIEYPVFEGFFKRKTHTIQAVNNATLAIPKGKTLGLVGESGSGKSTLIKAITRLIPITQGSIFYEETPIHTISPKAFLPYRKKIQTIFQDPYSSLNPRMSIQKSIQEPLDIHFNHWSSAQKEERITQLLKKVGLNPDHRHRYPHEFSGGQRQRIVIARALAVDPECILCDEPVSALDVSVQAQIIHLLQDLQAELNLTYLFISHDLAVVEHISDSIAVMQKGTIIEKGPANTFYKEANHPYTKQLLEAVPKL